jgi:hypothetical protein
VLGGLFVHSPVETGFQGLNHTSSVSDLPLLRDQLKHTGGEFFKISGKLNKLREVFKQKCVP